MLYPFKSVAVNANGSIIASADVEVRNRSGALATIYTSTGGAQTNPFSTDADGEFEFYAGRGVYFIVTGTDPSDYAETVALGDGFDTVAGLIADTSMRYTPSADYQTPVVAGGNVMAGGYTYEVAASGASDHDATTAGGVKLYVVAGAEGSDLDAYGATGDGVADDTAFVTAAAEPVVLNSGSLYLTTASSVTKETSGRGQLILDDPPRGHSAHVIEGRALVSPMAWTPPILPVYQAGRWTPDMSLEEWFGDNGSATDVYVHGLLGDDAAAGSEAAPFKTVSHALGLSGDYNIYVAPIAGGYDRDNGIGSTTGMSDVKVVKPWDAYSGRLMMGRYHNLGTAFTLDTGTTYVADADNVVRVVDFHPSENVEGCPIRTEYAEAADLTECRATPGTWFHDSVASPEKTYITMVSGLSPQGSVMMVTNDNHVVGGFPDLYFQGITFVGGGDGFEVDVNSTTKKFAFDSCDFILGCDGNGLSVSTGSVVASHRCRAYQNERDGFNYHEKASNPCFAVEIDCIGVANGGNGQTNNQGSTMHEAGSILRIGGRYGLGFGQSVSDVNTDTETWMIGTELLPSLLPLDSISSASATFQDGEAWLYRVTASSLVVRSGAATINVDTISLQGDYSPASGSGWAAYRQA